MSNLKYSQSKQSQIGVSDEDEVPNYVKQKPDSKKTRLFFQI